LTRKQQSDLFGFRVQLLPVTTNLITTPHYPLTQNVKQENWKYQLSKPFDLTRQGN